ncbi:hypothetical protein T12_7337 [Trichinella patagoniensis]|uniref:Uncharacterized protein n=1 Tax=Trichinella patagoniensis TaxID=990121 RepID=A0A0V1ADQ0_9BILA|nr:hypothetical protein T12_7337 [Trichinella patagoniensis]
MENDEMQFFNYQNCTIIAISNLYKVTYFNLANPLEKVMITCSSPLTTNMYRYRSYKHIFIVFFHFQLIAIKNYYISNVTLCSKLKRNTCYYVKIKRFARDYFSKLSSIIT